MVQNRVPLTAGLMVNVGCRASGPSPSRLPCRPPASRITSTLLWPFGMRDSGVELVAGTDLAGPDILPGFGLHDELRLLVRAGLTPMEALQAATRNAARQADRGKELGTIEPGKLADLVILSRDPLDDIGNITSTEAVILRGRLIDAAERKRLLEDARRAATER